MRVEKDNSACVLRRASLASADRSIMSEVNTFKLLLLSNRTRFVEDTDGCAWKAMTTMAAAIY
jgi:hypothetical protein